MIVAGDGTRPWLSISAGGGDQLIYRWKVKPTVGSEAEKSGEPFQPGAVCLPCVSGIAENVKSGGRVRETTGIPRDVIGGGGGNLLSGHVFSE